MRRLQNHSKRRKQHTPYLRSTTCNFYPPGTIFHSCEHTRIWIPNSHICILFLVNLHFQVFGHKNKKLRNIRIAKFTSPRKFASPLNDHVADEISPNARVSYTRIASSFFHSNYIEVQTRKRKSRKRWVRCRSDEPTRANAVRITTNFNIQHHRLKTDARSPNVRVLMANFRRSHLKQWVDMERNRGYTYISEECRELSGQKVNSEKNKNVQRLATAHGTADTYKGAEGGCTWTGNDWMR